MGEGPPTDAELPRPPLVIGLGNDARGDDAAGLLVARRLRAKASEPCDVRELSTEVTALLDTWEGTPLTVVVDAVRSGQHVGSVLRIEAGVDPLPTSFGGTSTHGLSLADAIALGRALGRLPGRLVLFGIEGRRFGQGELPSVEVAAAVEPAALRVELEIRRFLDLSRAPSSRKPADA